MHPCLDCVSGVTGVIRFAGALELFTARSLSSAYTRRYWFYAWGKELGDTCHNTLSLSLAPSLSLSLPLSLYLSLSSLSVRLLLSHGISISPSAFFCLSLSLPR